MSFAKRPDVVNVKGQDAVLVIPSERQRAGGGAQPAGQPRFRELEILATWLDSIFKIPGVNIRFGLDALLGLIPGLGDTVTSVASIYILLAAAQMGVPRVTIMRMAANIGLDYAVGAIPLVGDLFDVAWKANNKNVELLKRNASADRSTKRKLQLQDWLFVGALAFCLIALLVGSVTIAWWIVGSLVNLMRPAA